MSDHAGPKTTHALLAALRHAGQIARDESATRESRDAATAVVLLLNDAIPDVAALHELIERLNLDMRGMCQESLESAREITQLRARVLDAEQTTERVVEGMTYAFGRYAAAFTELRRLPARLSGETPRPMGVMRESLPRAATAG